MPDVTQLLDGASATTTAAVTDPHLYSKHLFGFTATGGAWSYVLEWSPDGTSWIECSDTLALSSGESGSIFFEGVVDRLRVVATRTGGSSDGWVSSSGAREA